MHKLYNASLVFLDKKEYNKAYYCIQKLWEDFPDERDTAYELINDFRKRLVAEQCKLGSDVKNILDTRKRTYLLTARDKFDDFMIYIEWNRPLKEKYWLPRRSKLMVACQVLQDMEDGKMDELFLSMPPRVGKTTLMVFFVLWVILRDSERSNLYTSYTQSVVDVFYNGLLEILGDRTTYLWHDVFPECEVVSTNAKDFLLNINRKKRYASFTGRSLYGTLNGACDCNGYEIADDLISGIEEAMNKDRLDSAWAKVDNNYLPRAKEGAKRLWIGTRWSISDPIARRINLLETDERFKNVRYKIINFPALDENDKSNFEYSCGVGFSSDYYIQRRASFERNNDIASWMAQYMGSPIERDGSVFCPEDLRYYNGTLPEAEPDRIFIAVDPAWGGGDFTAAPICFQYGNDIYVHDVVFNNQDKTVTQPLIVQKAIKWGVQAITIEATRTTSSYTEGVNNLLRDKGYRLNVQSSTKSFTGEGKRQRIFDKAPDIRECMVFRESGCRSKEYEQFMQNIFAFHLTMNKKAHDDAPDSCVMAINMAFMHPQVIGIYKRKF